MDLVDQPAAEEELLEESEEESDEGEGAVERGMVTPEMLKGLESDLIQSNVSLRFLPKAETEVSPC